MYCFFVSEATSAGFGLDLELPPGIASSSRGVSGKESDKGVINPGLLNSMGVKLTSSNPPRTEEEDPLYRQSTDMQAIAANPKRTEMEAARC